MLCNEYDTYIDFLVRNGPAIVTRKIDIVCIEGILLFKELHSAS